MAAWLHGEKKTTKNGWHDIILIIPTKHIDCTIWGVSEIEVIIPKWLIILIGRMITNQWMEWVLYFQTNPYEHGMVSDP